MKVIAEGKIRRGLYELAALVGVPVEDLKEEFEKTVEDVSGKNATFLGADDLGLNRQLQTLALEKMYKAYKKPLQFRKFLNDIAKEDQAKEEEDVEDAEEIEEAEVGED